MRRAFANLLLSLLLLATVVWGGCVSCEQYFMWPGAKSCCTRNGQCKTKAPQSQQAGRECKQIAFGHQKSFQFHIDLATVAVLACELPQRITEPLTFRSSLHLVEPSPPDLQVLHSSFLI
jgi:hypothetical protein